jgi:hypothetical protein
MLLMMTAKLDAKRQHGWLKQATACRDRLGGNAFMFETDGGIEQIDIALAGRGAATALGGGGRGDIGEREQCAC